MEQICPSEKCTGCFACENVCPKQCISLKHNLYGELHPVINQDLCINCHLCEKTCPNNRTLDFETPTDCYAAWRTNKELRTESASGGIGAIFGEYMIKSNGVVFGTKYDTDITPVTAIAHTIDELEPFKGSKYVQAIVGRTFSEIRKALELGKNVVYIATPCQIAGLKSFLKKDYENLISVDLICHGVCPTSYFKEEINYLKEIYNIKQISNVTFRGNGKKFNHRLNFFLTIFDGKKVMYNRFSNRQYYFHGFLSGITLRENCYNCQYARPERISDITIGDFLGLGNDIPFHGPRKNTSLVLINTSKGKQFWDNVCRTTEDLSFTIRPFEEAVKYGTSLKGPFPRHALNEKFRNLYLRVGYVKAIRKLLFWPIFKIKLKYPFYVLLKKLPLQLLSRIKNR